VDQVIPIDWARKSPGILENLGIQTVYKEYTIGHGVSHQNFYDFKIGYYSNKKRFLRTFFSLFLIQ